MPNIPICPLSPTPPFILLSVSSVLSVVLPGCTPPGSPRRPAPQAGTTAKSDHPTARCASRTNHPVTDTHLSCSHATPPPSFGARFHSRAGLFPYAKLSKNKLNSRSSNDHYVLMRIFFSGLKICRSLTNRHFLRSSNHLRFRSSTFLTLPIFPTLVQNFS